MKEVHHQPFSELSTFHIGGKIKRVLYPETVDECVRALQALARDGSEYFILGGGSNILPSDDDYDGVVVVPACTNIEYTKSNDATVEVIADAGVSWDALVKETVDKNLWGMENLSGIPGLVGASPIQNIGAYGTDVSETIQWVEVYDTHTEKVSTLSNADLCFGYRTSRLKKERGRFVVLRVCFALSAVERPNVSYKDVRTHFDTTKETPTLSTIREAVLQIRATKFPDLNIYGTAGSFFTNPIVSKQEAERILALFPDAVHFPEGEEVKFSLAWILDNVLNVKGMREGCAVVWHAQPLVLVAEKGATAQEVRTLAEKISTLVKEKVGITIVPEVLLL